MGVLVSAVEMAVRPGMLVLLREVEAVPLLLPLPPVIVQLGPTMPFPCAPPVAPRCRSVRKPFSLAICTSRFRMSLAHIVRISVTVLSVRASFSFSRRVVVSADRCAVTAAASEDSARLVWRSRVVFVVVSRASVVLEVSRSLRNVVRVEARAVDVDWAR